MQAWHGPMIWTPMVEVVADKESIHEKNEEYFNNFDVVCMNDFPADAQVSS